MRRCLHSLLIGVLTFSSTFDVARACGAMHHWRRCHPVCPTPLPIVHDVVQWDGCGSLVIVRSGIAPAAFVGDVCGPCGPVFAGPVVGGVGGCEEIACGAPLPCCGERVVIDAPSATAGAASGPATASVESVMAPTPAEPIAPAEPPVPPTPVPAPPTPEPIAATVVPNLEPVAPAAAEEPAADESPLEVAQPESPAAEPPAEPPMEEAAPVAVEPEPVIDEPAPAFVEPPAREPQPEPAPKNAFEEEDEAVPENAAPATATTEEPALEPEPVVNEPAIEPQPAADPEPEIEPEPAIEPALEAPSAAAEPVRRWIDDTGSYAVVGRLLDVRGDAVEILKTDGRAVTVPLSRLSGFDRGYVAEAGPRVAAARRPSPRDTAGR